MNQDIPITLKKNPSTGVEEIKKLTYKPAVDIYETNEQIVILLEMPNVDRETMKVSVKDGLLKISGQKKKYNEGITGEFLLHETREGTYERIFQLDKDIDQENIEARYENGILSVILKKKQTRRKIEVK